MSYVAPPANHWKTIRRIAFILMFASALLSAITMVLLVNRPSWLLAICLLAQVATAVMQIKILKVSRNYVQ